MRIGGIASGMDTDSLIRDMMNANRVPLDKITNKKQKLEWQLDDYRSVNRNLRTLQYSLSDTVNKQSTYVSKTVSISKPDALSVKSINSTSDFSGTIAVHQLAKNATMQSKGEVIAPGSDYNKSLKDLDLHTGDDSSFRITAIQADGKFDVNKPDADPPYIAGYEVKFTENSTLKSIIDDINTNSDVSAFYDSATGKIAFTAKNSGDVKDGPEIVFTGVPAFLNIDADNTEAANNGNGTAGQNAEFTFNGLTTSRSSNAFQINGFEFNVKQITSPYKEGTKEVEADVGVVTFSSTADVDKVLDAVVKFVDDYNKMIEELNAKIREPIYRNFQPLTAEQKKDMKEKEIEQWEEKAKSGSLKNDPAITSMLSSLRGIMNSSIETSDGKKVSLADLGIKPTKSYLENGKLEINEGTLRKAIADDPNKVYELIGKANDDDLKNEGLSVQYRKVLEKSQSVISKRAGSTGASNESFTLGSTLKDMDKQIERFEERLKMVENRLWRQFTAMEQAINRANAQSAQLMSSLGGGM